MKVSLILATIGRTTEIGRCLRSLAAQTDTNFEVLLVDQNLDDRLLPFVQEAAALGLNLTHLRMSVPSLSGARNLGLSKAQGDIVGLTDDDCWYEANAISAVRTAFLCAPQLDGVVAQWAEHAESNANKRPTEILSLEAWRRFRGGDASSIRLFFKLALLNRLGGFDERFGVGQWFGAAEEIDLVLRALSAGAYLAPSPQARVHHNMPDDSNAPLLTVARNIRKRSRGTGGIYAKHRLSAWTVLRGFTAPALMPLMHGKFRTALIGAFVALGRLEGFMAWKLKGLR